MCDKKVKNFIAFLRKILKKLEFRVFLDLTKNFAVILMI